MGFWRSESYAFGRWKAAEWGRWTLIHRSHTTAIVCSTVSDENKAASWNERPRPCSARDAGPMEVMSRPFRWIAPESSLK